MRKKGDFNQLQYNNEYKRNNYRRYALMVPLKRSDIIEHLEKQTSKNAYIIKLIEDDIIRNSKI